ncbi:MAG: hypothetical protein ACLFUB_11050 [Cyclobacteriaceae bacterium]
MMAKQKLYTCLALILFSHSLFGQSSSCNHWIQKAINSNIIERSEIDTIAFCKGVKEAYEEEELVKLMYPDAYDLTDCEVYAYDKYGVKIQGSVSNVELGVQSSLPFKVGYNIVMQAKIKERLANDYDKVGEIQEDWYAIDLGFFTDLTKHLVAQPIGIDSAVVTLEQQPTDSLDQIIVYHPLDTTQTHPFSDLYHGIKLYNHGFKRLFLSFDKKNYTGGENYCKVEKDNDKFAVPVEITDEY